MRLEGAAFMDVVLDVTAPEVGTAAVVTSEYPNGEVTPKVCQRSSTTMKIEFHDFRDLETGIDR